MKSKTANRKVTVSLTSLQTKVVRELVALVRREHKKRGDHLTELALVQQIKTSRSPIQAALKHLAELGLLTQDVNRGFFLAKDSNQWGDIAAALTTAPDDPLYLQIAQDYRAGTLASEVSENELMRRYGVARGGLRKVLARISAEGWVAQNLGHGWSFLPLIDSPQAYEESYWFRQAIEPVALLSPSFKFNAQELTALQVEQQRIVDGGFKTMTAIELFEANSRFHETLAAWSDNRFILQSVRRVNQQRRLVEYSQASQRAPRQTQAREHLTILDAIAKQDLVEAASLMRHHLDGARRAKSVFKFC